MFNTNADILKIYLICSWLNLEIQPTDTEGQLYNLKVNSFGPGKIHSYFSISVIFRMPKNSEAVGFVIWWCVHTSH